VRLPAPLRFWLITLAMLVVTGATLALGAWQLDRGRQRDALQAAIQERQQLPPLPQEALASGAATADLLHRPVLLRGTWLARHTVFLDNRQMRGKPGFYVVTPLRLEGSGSVVLVERGWAPRNFADRAQLPPVRTADGPVTVRGRIAPPPAKLYEFDGAQPGTIRQNLDLDRFRAETGLPLLALAVRQTGDDAADGLLRDWPEPGSGAEKNYGYAFQWWALSALTAILYVWFQFIAPRRKAPHA
jgi:surfeit locus 1 family protein